MQKRTSASVILICSYSGEWARTRSDGNSPFWRVEKSAEFGEFTEFDRMDPQVYQNIIGALSCIANPQSPPEMRALAEQKVTEFQEADYSIDYAMTSLVNPDPSRAACAFSVV